MLPPTTATLSLSLSFSADISSSLDAVVAELLSFAPAGSVATSTLTFSIHGSFLLAVPDAASLLNGASAAAQFIQFAIAEHLGLTSVGNVHLLDNSAPGARRLLSADIGYVVVGLLSLESASAAAEAASSLADAGGELAGAAYGLGLPLPVAGSSPTVGCELTITIALPDSADAASAVASRGSKAAVPQAAAAHRRRPPAPPHTYGSG